MVQGIKGSRSILMAKVLLAVVLWVVYFLVIMIAWTEFFTIPRGYQVAGMLGISGDKDIYNFIADLSLVISIIGAYILTFLSLKVLMKE